MSIRLSRRKIAAYVADKIATGGNRIDALAEVAAYLVIARRTRELDLLVRDIEDALSGRGIIVADATSAHPLSLRLKAKIEELIGGKNVQFREVVDSDMLGGVRVDIPGKRFDGTMRHKLALLKSKQL